MPLALHIYKLQPTRIIDRTYPRGQLFNLLPFFFHLSLLMQPPNTPPIPRTKFRSAPLSTRKHTHVRRHYRAVVTHRRRTRNKFQIHRECHVCYIVSANIKATFEKPASLAHSVAVIPRAFLCPMRDAAAVLNRSHCTASTLPP